jgi:hypothetical protein
MRFNRNRVQIDMYINYGNDTIVHRTLVAEPGINILDALKVVTDIDYTHDESATGHLGAMVTAINGVKVDINHFWIYYVLDENLGGWRIPACTPDSLKITEDTRIAWRYHDATSGKDIPRHGPRYTTSCMNKIRRCNRQF